MHFQIHPPLSGRGDQEDERSAIVVNVLQIFVVSKDDHQKIVIPKRGNQSTAPAHRGRLLERVNYLNDGGAGHKRGRICD